MEKKNKMTTERVEQVERETLQEIIDRTLIAGSRTSEQFRKRVEHYQNFQLLCEYKRPQLRTPRYMNATTKSRAEKYWIKYLEEIESYHGGDTEDLVCNGLNNAFEHHYGQSLGEYLGANIKLLLCGLTRKRMKEAHRRIITRKMTEEEYSKLQRIFGEGEKE